MLDERNEYRNKVVTGANVKGVLPPGAHASPSVPTMSIGDDGTHVPDPLLIEGNQKGKTFF